MRASRQLVKAPRPPFRTAQTSERSEGPGRTEGGPRDMRERGRALWPEDKNSRINLIFYQTKRDFRFIIDLFFLSKTNIYIYLLNLDFI